MSPCFVFDARAGNLGVLGMRHICQTILLLFFVALRLAVDMAAQPHPDAGAEGARWLAREGVFQGKIYIPQNAVPEERDAAAVLAEWFHKVAAVKPEVATESPLSPGGAPPSPAPGIYVGRTRLAASQETMFPKTAGDAWLWRPVGPRMLLLLGNTPLATRMAVGEFIQQHLGVIFLMPGENGAEWHPLPVVRMPSARIEIPVFKWRHFSGFDANPSQIAWLRDNGLGELPLRTKTPCAKSIAPAGPRLPAPKTVAATAKCVADFFQSDPAVPMFLLGAEDFPARDSPDFPSNLSPAGRYFRGRPDHTNHFYVFMNQAASALWPAPPPVPGVPRWEPARWNGHAPAGDVIPQPIPSERFLACLAGGNHIRVPDFPLHPNLFPILASDRSQWRDPVFRRHDIKTIRAWSGSGVRQFGLRDSYQGRGFAVPRVFFDERIDSIRCGVENNATLFHAQSLPEWAFDAPSLWLAARLLLHPAQNSALLLNHFFNEAYGPAASAMGVFFDELSRCWDDAGPARDLKFIHNEGVGDLVPAATQARLREALQRAEAAFDNLPAQTGALFASAMRRRASPHGASFSNKWPNDEDARLARQQMRVRMVSLAFEVVEQFLHWHRARVSLQEFEPTTPDEARAMLRELVREQKLRLEYDRCRARWDDSEINPARNSTPPHPQFFADDVRNTAITRLLRLCASGGATGDGDWQGVFSEVVAYAQQQGDAALVALGAEFNPAIPLFEENFAVHSDNSGTLGAALAPRRENDAGVLSAPDAPQPHLPAGVRSLPPPPWKAELTDCETLFVRIAPLDIASAAGIPPFLFLENKKKSLFGKSPAPVARLQITGSENVVLSRDVSGITAGVPISAEIFVRGAITSSAVAKLELRFFDANGLPLPGSRTAAILRAAPERWRPIAILATPPPAATTVRVSLVCRTQESNETLEFALLRLRAHPPASF